MKLHQIVVSLLFLCVNVHAIGFAQYFDPEETESGRGRYISGGAVLSDFRPLSTNSRPDSTMIRYSTWVPMISARQDLFTIYFGYGTFDLGGTRKSTVIFGLEVGTAFPLSRGSDLSVPVSLGVNYTRAGSPGPEKETFNIASTGIGLGIMYRAQGSRFDFRISASEFFHYSFEGFNTGAGFSAATVGDVTLWAKNWLVLNGVLFGYRFRYQTWAMNNKNLNYRSLSHGPFIGLSF